MKSSIYINSNINQIKNCIGFSLVFLFLSLTFPFSLTSQDLGNGFYDHGVASPNSNHRGTVATVDGNGRNVVLLWLFDHRGGYALQMIDAETGKSEQFPMPFPVGDAVYSSILSSKNKFYTLFNNNFAEFDPVKRAFTFYKESMPQMAMGMTEDDKGVIWAVTYPNSGVISFNPETREFRDYGYVYRQNWRQYQRYVAADDAGWIYFSIGNTASQIISFNPVTGEVKPTLDEPDRKRGSAYLYRDLNGKVYGQALQDSSEPWYEFHKGKVRRKGKHDIIQPKPMITGGQSLFYRDFPDGKKLKSLDLLERKLIVEDPKTSTEKIVSFDYASEGAWVMGVAASPDGTIAGGTTFPMRFFNYNPKTGKLTDKEAFGQYDALARQGDRFYFGVYPTGSLLEWDPSKPWINTKVGEETNPLLLASSSLVTHRPHRVLAYPDGKTIIMSGTPEYGYTGGGLLFWDREKKSQILLKDTAVILDQSTFSIDALPLGKFIGGTTTAPGTGGIRKAKEAELYIMDLTSKRIEWHKAIFPGVQEYSDICLGPDGLVYGIYDRKKFFVYDPVKLNVVHHQDIPSDFGSTVAKESLRIFILGPNKEMYMLFKNGIVQVEPGSFRMTMKAVSPVPINTGGDYLDGRIYFVSGSHLCSYRLDPTKIYGGFYTEERISNLRKNCEKYDWAKMRRETVIAKAETWLAKSDEELWAMVPGQDLPRAIDVTFDRLVAGPKSLGCQICGEKITKYGNYPYEPDIEKLPWKLTCPSCKSVFPTNDFFKYYKSAIDEHGLFNPSKGDRSLLFNADHPDPKDPLHKFGVDDGFGYIDKNGRAHRYIGYYVWKYWSYLNDGLSALADGFIYTGDKQYAHKAAILLDRIADVYPDMDWKPYADRGWYHSDGGSMLGKVGGSIWETGVAQQFADSYDKILSGTNDDAGLYTFLKRQSEKYALPKAKGTRDNFVENVDKGILHTSFDAVLSRQIRGNQGMHQMTVATCAMALNTEPTTTKWLDWLFAPDGGAIPGLMISRFDRDGTSDEGAPGYALIWGRLINDLAELLGDTTFYNRNNIFRDFPQFSAAYTVAHRMSALGLATPNMGDAGATGLVTSVANPNFMARGYFYTRNPDIAIASYRANGNSAEGLGRDIFSSDPEELGREIRKIGEKAGPRPEGGYLMSGFGLALLESGTGKAGVALVNNYGRTKMHAHPDMLNFDLFAFGHWLAPDHGYPEFASNIPSNTDWTGSTISHNLVYVNRHPQKDAWGGHTRLFKQLNGFGVFEIDGQKAYPEVKEYARTMFLIDGTGGTSSGNNAYVVDIFNVSGGNDHVFSFHGPPGIVDVKGLKLENQKTGTYAGEQILKGVPAKNFPVGYSHLYNVRKDNNPPLQFMLDWKVQPGYRGLTAKDDVHLRMYALSKSHDVSLADGDPPQNKAGNPAKLGYVLMHRSDTDLTSKFVSVIEPYSKNPFIKSVKRLDDGKGTEIAIQIENVDGSFDYILYNTDSQKEMRLMNGITMNGKIGYVREKDGIVVKGILINGSVLKHGKMNLLSAGPITGTVIKMNKELAGGGWLIVDKELPTDGSLTGEQIIINTDTERDASYSIRSVERSGNQTKVFCGPISFVRDYKGGTMEVRTFTVPRDYSLGYLYDFEEGAQFIITSHKVWTPDSK